ncbi:minor capsid protein [Gemella sp. zg-570]|uniref:ADP-ribosyltransferase n=1 Tax=Gemella sp. zg-570 TaxID=2840371 RepID=UPI001C0E3CB2|nr:ADP-ribosyltransferase [Gemella sp. zg-570]QWQ39306.1 minor capsid protein [Gemella sp. zg-570]
MKTSSKYFEDRAAKNQWQTYYNTEKHSKKLIAIYEDLTRSLVDELMKVEELISKKGLSRSLAYRSKYLRLLQNRYKNEVLLLSKKVDKIYSNITDDISLKTYEDTSKELGFDIVYNDLSVKRLAQKPWLGANFKTRLGKNQAEMTKRLFETLQVGLNTGLSAVEMAIRLKNGVDRDFNKIMLLVRTEAMHHLNQVKLQAYKDSKVVKKLKDVVTLDDRTSEQCAVCAGNIYDIDNAPILPRHPRCRCVLVAYIDVDNLAKQFDREEASVDKALQAGSGGAIIKKEKVYKIADKETEERLQEVSDGVYKTFSGEQKEAIRYYTGDYSEDINTYLRNKDLGGVRDAKIEARVQALDAVLESNRLGYDLKLYRYTGKEEFKALQEGDYFKNYLSTSIHRTRTEHFGDGYKFIIQAPGQTKGYYIGKNSENPVEQEFLVHRNTRYKILNIDEEKGILEMELLEDE